MEKWNPDPVEFVDGKWVFWDETWAYPNGPFETEREAREALAEYAKTLENES